LGNKVGPGQYEIRSQILNKGFSKIKNTGFGSSGHSGFTASREKTPGPGAYSTAREAYNYNSVGFGTSKRKSTATSNTVGPGQYTQSDVSKLGRNDITLKSRHGDSMVNSQWVPGPG
jgi:hypothetical protein